MCSADPELASDWAVHLSAKGRMAMDRLLLSLSVLLASALLVPGDAAAQRFGGRGFGGGGGGARIGGFGSPQIGTGGAGFPRGAIAARPGGFYRGGLGGYRTVAIARPGMGGVYRPGMIYRPGFRGYGWRAPYYGRGWRYPYNGGYSPRYPYYGWGARRGTDTWGPELSVLRLWRLSDA
jgi:hypothetical protein